MTVTSAFNYLQVNNLEEIKIIAGNYCELSFAMYDSTGSPLDMSSSSGSWVCCPLGQPSYPVISKSGSLSTSTNEFIFVLTKDDTKDLSGKYQHQPVVTDLSGNEFRPGQGIITFIPRIA